MKNSKTVLIDKNPGRNAQTYGIARELNTDLDLIHEPSVGVVGNKGDSLCYIGVEKKVSVILRGIKIFSSRNLSNFIPEALSIIQPSTSIPTE
mgnify:CR=1 FL=1